MFSISVEVIRGIIGIRMRGSLTNAMRVELLEQLSSALETVPPLKYKDWTVRVTSKPLAEYTPELAASIQSLLQERNAWRKAQALPPPVSRVVNRKVDLESASARWCIS